MKRFVVILLLISCVVPLFGTIEASAGYSDDEIYDKDYMTGVEELPFYTELKEAIEKLSELPQYKAGKFLIDLVVGLFEWLFVHIGDLLLMTLADMGIDLDRIIYGRIGAGADPVVTTFAMVKGNPFGEGALLFYKAIFYMVIYLFYPVWIILGIRLALSGGNAQKLNEARSSIVAFIVLIGSLFVYPSMFKLVLYLRDSFQSGLMKVGMAISGNGTGSLIMGFRNAATDDADLLNAVVYCGMALVTLYYLYIYLGIALTLFLQFVTFPIVALLSVFPKNRKLVMDHISEVFSTLSVPLIDTSLLFLVMFFMSLKISSIIVFILLTLIPTARQTVRQNLGLSRSSMGLELAGMGMAFAAGRLMQGIGSSAVGAFNDIKNAGSDAGNADLYDDLAKVSNEGGEGNLIQTPSAYQNAGGKSYEEVYGTANQSLATPDSGISSAQSGTYEEYEKSAPQGMSSQQMEEQKVYDEHANTSWLNDSRANKLSHEKRAELYRERARKNRINGIGRFAGTLGGAAAGAGMTALMGPQGAVLGATAGSGIGGFVGDHTMDIADGAKNLGGQIGRRITDKFRSQETPGEDDNSIDIDNWEIVGEEAPFGYDSFTYGLGMENSQGSPLLSGDEEQAVYEGGTIEQRHNKALPGESMSKEYMENREEVHVIASNVVKDKNVAHRAEALATMAQKKVHSRQMQMKSKEIADQFGIDVNSDEMIGMHDQIERFVQDDFEMSQERESAYNSAKMEAIISEVSTKINKKYGNSKISEDFLKDIDSYPHVMSKKPDTTYDDEYDDINNDE